MLIDSFGRVHDYLRISVTDKCNFRCIYCMPPGTNVTTPLNKIMSVDEIDKLAGVFIKLGVNKIRITGGEPLLRKDITEILFRLSNYPAGLFLTTNAFFADKYINIFKTAGIKSINVSLDSLNPEEFARITKRNQFQKTFSNIIKLLENNFQVKVNFVVIRGLNENSIFDFLDWTKDYSLEVRFIEFMPFDRNNWSLQKVLSYDEILDLIRTRYEFYKAEDSLHDTSRKFRVYGHKGFFGIISTVSKPFCEGCNRLRLTSDGKLKNCLFSSVETDLLTPFRKNEDVIPLIHSSLFEKKKERGGQFSSEKIVNRSMVSIGG